MPAKIFGVGNVLMKVKKNINVHFLKVSFKIATSQVVLWIGNILMLVNKDAGKHNPGLQIRIRICMDPH
jgi:hypothetical protein